MEAGRAHTETWTTTRGTGVEGVEAEEIGDLPKREMLIGRDSVIVTGSESCANMASVNRGPLFWDGARVPVGPHPRGKA